MGNQELEESTNPKSLGVYCIIELFSIFIDQKVNKLKHDLRLARNFKPETLLSSQTSDSCNLISKLVNETMKVLKNEVISRNLFIISRFSH